MLNLDDKSYWGNSQYINNWWSNSYAQWEELPDLEDRSFHIWLRALLQAHGVFDSNWYMAKNNHLNDVPPVVLRYLGYKTEFITAWGDNEFNHYLMYYKYKNIEVIEFFFDQSPDSGRTLYFVREV